MVRPDRQRPELVEREAPVREGGGDRLDAVQLGLPLRVGGLLPRAGPLEGHLVPAQDLPQPLPPDGDHPHRVGGQVVGQLADTPAGEGHTQLLRSGQRGRDDVGRLVRTDSAGTTTRPPRVQAGQPDLVEPVDDLPDRVLIGLNQPCDGRHRGSAGRRHDDQSAADPDRPVPAAPHDLLELATLLIGQPPCPYPFCHRHHPMTEAVVDLYHGTSRQTHRHTVKVCGQRTQCRRSGWSLDQLAAAVGTRSVEPLVRAVPAERALKGAHRRVRR